MAVAPSPLKKIEAQSNILPETNQEAVETIKIEEPPIVQPETKVAEIAPPVAPPATCASEIAKYDWPVSIATAVAKAESRLKKDSHGDKTLTYTQNGIKYGDSWGCFQVRYLPGRPTPSELVKPEVNVAYAYKLYKGQGWKPWTMYNNGTYKKYL